MSIHNDAVSTYLECKIGANSIHICICVFFRFHYCFFNWLTKENSVENLMKILIL